MSEILTSEMAAEKQFVFQSGGLVVTFNSNPARLQLMRSRRQKDDNVILHVSLNITESIMKPIPI